MIKVSVVITVKNAAVELPELFSALENQFHSPDEVVITVARSSDSTAEVAKAWKPQFPVRVFEVDGNRSIGRNISIQKAKYSVIAVTDAGCVPSHNWLSELVKPFEDVSVEIVAGFTKAFARSEVQQVCAAYLLVMPDKVPKFYLPATRSMAFRRSAWKRLGGFPEHLIVSEDYFFARSILKKNLRLVFRPKALVVWTPPNSLRELIRQSERFAYWDARGGEVRWKALTMPLRYLAILLAAILSPPFGLALLVLYLFFAWQKNRKYVHTWKSLYLLPLTQILTDCAVMLGTYRGLSDAGLDAAEA